MAVRCPQCLGVSGDDDATCAWCGQNLYDQVVVFVEEPIVPAPQSSSRPRWVPADAWADDDARGSITAQSLVNAPGLGRLGRPGPTDRDPMPTVSATLVVSRVIGLSGPASEAALDCWWKGHQPYPGVEAGRVQLTLRELIHHPTDGCLCHATARWSHRLAWRSEQMEIELLPWSARSSELTLRPIRYRANRSDGYFRTAYALVEMIAAELVKTGSSR
ncbi:MAG: hypothetical protein NVSMB16_04490 [Acidimicrobiales bacterium]